MGIVPSFYYTFFTSSNWEFWKMWDFRSSNSWRTWLWRDTTGLEESFFQRHIVSTPFHKEILLCRTNILPLKVVNQKPWRSYENQLKRRCNAELSCGHLLGFTSMACCDMSLATTIYIKSCMLGWTNFLTVQRMNYWHSGSAYTSPWWLSWTNILPFGFDDFYLVHGCLSTLVILL